MNLDYINPLNLIREIFFPTHAYFREAQTRQDYSSHSLDGFRIFPEDLRPAEKERKDIEKKIEENIVQFTPGKDFPGYKPVR